jgi:hypothetical protein
MELGDYTMSVQFAVLSWEEMASDMPRSAPDTDRMLAAVYYRFEVEGVEVTDMSVIGGEYFQRARWPKPTNLPATANYCAGKGWLTKAGMDGRSKLWRITRKGYEYIRAHLIGGQEG